MKIVNIRANIISLSKKRKDYNKSECKHYSMTIDDSKSHVTCNDCGKELNAIWVLSRFATEEGNMRNELKHDKVRLENIKTALSRKQRTKCKHCGKMTDININMSSREWAGWDLIKDE